MWTRGAEQLLTKAIQLAEQVIRWAAEAQSYRQECAQLKSRAEHLAALLRQAARADLYERPARRIVSDTEQSLDNALALLLRCRSRGVVGRAFTTIPASTFEKVSEQLDGSIGDVSWLLRISSASSSGDGEDGDTFLGLPPSSQSDPNIFFIWEQIATLHTGSADARSDAAACLESLARDNDRNGKFIIEEDGVGHLLRLVKEGQVEGQENAARVIALLGRDPESVDKMVRLGLCSVFAQALKEGPIRTQTVVAWAVAELAAAYPKCQDLFAQNKVVPLLVGHLSFETEQNQDRLRRIPTGPSTMSRRTVDSATNTKMKAMAAKALWQLAKGNPAVCKSITESKALLYFAVLLEKGTDEARYNSAMALMEIAKVAELDADIQRFAFKPNLPAAKAVLDQLLSVVEKAECDDLLIPCITSLGCLASTFRATETRIIGPLVRLLDERESEVSKEAAIALTKFACPESNLYLDHSRAIIAAGGLEHLVQLVYWGEQAVQITALVLLCYITLHVPHSEDLVQRGVLSVLRWASTRVHLVQDPRLDSLLPEAKGRLELHQPSGPSGFS